MVPWRCKVGSLLLLVSARISSWLQLIAAVNTPSSLLYRFGSLSLAEYDFIYTHFIGSAFFSLCSFG